jgi:hypothetical protein
MARKDKQYELLLSEIIKLEVKLTSSVALTNKKNNSHLLWWENTKLI